MPPAVQAQKAQRLHDDRMAMHKTLAENDENIKAKKRAAKQQVRLALLGGEPVAILCVGQRLHASVCQYRS